jgi:hypothetical protein
MSSRTLGGAAVGRLGTFTVRIASALSLSLVACFSVFAQTETVQPQKDSRAVAILSSYVRASGPAAATIQDFTASGTVTYFWAGKEVEAPATAKDLGALGFRLDAQLAEGTRKCVVSMEGGTLRKADGSASRIHWGDAVNLISATWPLPVVVAALNDPSTEIRYVGEVTFGSRTAYDIRIERIFPASLDPSGRFSKLTVKDFFVDASTYLMDGLEDQTHGQDSSGRTYKHRILFSDYRQVNGSILPFSVSETITGQKTWSFQLNSIAFNTGLTSADFSL